MTIKEISDWCMEHIDMRRRDSYVERGRYTIHKVEFENGDIYEQTDEQIGYWDKRVKIYLNGALENETVYHYDNFGWKEAV